MAEKKKKGLIDRATDYVTDLGTKYLAGRKQMSENMRERIANPTAPPKDTATLPRPKKKKKKKKEPRGGVGGVLDLIQERKRKMREAYEE